MRLLSLLACAALLCGRAGAAETTSSVVSFQHDDARGELRALAGNRELFVYNYSTSDSLPHFFPLNTPSGKNLLVEKTEPYPHHRAFWVSDTVIRDGVKGDIYNSYYSGKKLPRKTGPDAVKREHGPPFNTASVHKAFREVCRTEGAARGYEEDLVWETSRTTTTFPLLDEHRNVQVHLLQDGAYLVDFQFTLTAAYGDVKFVSDQVHYAWPFLRINKQFSPEGGGTLTNDRNTTGQERTNLKPAKWIDYSNTINGATEGVTMFQFPHGDPDPLWLTRDYGTFGPRRPEAQSGKPFTLKKGESLHQRVGIYVHNGNAADARLGDMYTRYVNGKVH
jgi:hypothetical protein